MRCRGRRAEGFGSGGGGGVAGFITHGAGTNRLKGANEINFVTLFSFFVFNKYLHNKKLCANKQSMWLE